MLKILLIAVILILFAGCASTSTDTATPINSPEILKITAIDLANAYKANEINADKLYKGRMIEMNGTIYDISDILGTQSITITGQDYNNVLCYFKANQKDKLATLQKDQEIILTGIVEGYSLMTVVKNCEIK